jgi:hypothetical protein
VVGACSDVNEPLADAPADSESIVLAIEDVASFVPTPPADDMQPAKGIAVRRLPANFLSQATEQVVSATLLGLPAEVRFTPVAFTWDTGDGGRVEATSPGATWERLRQAELTDTPTSHRYEERGAYTVQPTVTYAAEYRFDGSDWSLLDGTLDQPGPSYQLRIVTVETRLTRGSCLQFPNDTGCN